MGSTHSLTHSPMIHTIVGAGGAALLAATAPLGMWSFAMALGALALFFAFTWPSLIRTPDRMRARIVLGITLLMAYTAASWDSIQGVVLAASFSLILAFVSEMTRPDRDSTLLSQISSVFMGSLLIITSSLWLLTARDNLGLRLVWTAAVVLAVVSIIEIIPARTVHAVAFVNGFVAGELMCIALSLSAWVGLVLAVLVTLAYAATVKVAPTFPGNVTTYTQVATALMPLLTLSVVLFLLSHVLI